MAMVVAMAAATAAAATNEDKFMSDKKKTILTPYELAEIWKSNDRCGCRIPCGGKEEHKRAVHEKLEKRAKEREGK